MNEDEIGQMIDAIANGDFATAETIFGELMNDKVADTLEAERVAVAASIYGTSEIEDNGARTDEADQNDENSDEDE